jgi:hypothetical protein
VSQPGQRSGPGVDPGTAAESRLATTTSLDTAIMPRPTNRPRFNLGRVLDRRHASLELDRMLDCYPYPDPHELYGPTAALARLLEADSS